jgi:AcrR family transcriptional regulator
VPRLSQRSRDARRRQILAAARTCFARNGFQATSMQDIFAESGLSAGAVYSHFTGKDELVLAIADDVLDTIAAAVEATLDHDDPPALDRVLAGIFDVLERADVAAIAITVWSEAVHHTALAERLSTRYTTMRARLTRIVAAHQKSGVLDPHPRAEDIAHVLTALGPAFLCQRAFDPSVDAATFTRGLSALLPAGSP